MMRVLKVVAEGITTSFRYPHFVQTIHPTFEMPPPATLYGHICSALGEWVDPQGIEFACHFTFEGRAVDLEHIHVLKRGSGRAMEGSDLPEALSGNVNPFERHLLFRPRLVLYLNRPEWAAAFRSPRYAVVLGRSQDLFTYTRVETVELAAAQQAYLEHTLMPYEMATATPRGYTVLMPRYLDYHNGRQPAFARYVVLHERVPTSELRTFVGRDAATYWIDPESPEDKGQHLGLVFQSFVGDAHESLSLA
jgi:CRISPR-associated protein Cas5t